MGRMSQSRPGECFIDHVDAGGKCKKDATHEVWYEKKEQWVPYCYTHAEYVNSYWHTAVRLLGTEDTEEGWDD